MGYMRAVCSITFGEGVFDMGYMPLDPDHRSPAPNYTTNHFSNREAHVEATREYERLEDEVDSTLDINTGRRDSSSTLV